MSNSPAHKIRIANLQATIWRNAGDKGTWYSVQTTRGYKVDDGWRDRLQLADFLARLAVGQRDEQDVDRLQRCAWLELELGPPPQVRVHGVHELSAEALGCHLCHFDLGVGKEETKQLSAGVPGPADDRGLHRARWLSAQVSTSTPRAKSPRSMNSSGVWSSLESPGP